MVAHKKAPTTRPKKTPQAGPSDKASDGFSVVRAKSALISVPGTVIFSSLIVPDDRFGDPKFNIRMGFTSEAWEKLAEQIKDHCMTPLFAALKEAYKGKKELVACDVGDWVEGQKTPPHEKAKFDLHTMQFTCNSQFKSKKTDTIEPITIKAWDGKNHPLDLKALRMGSGSIVQAVVTPGLFVSSLTKGKATPTLRLQGIRVLKLEQYGNGGAQLGDLTEDDLAALGDEFEVEDLGAYTQAAEKPKPQANLSTDLDDEIPF